MGRKQRRTERKSRPRTGPIPAETARADKTGISFPEKRRWLWRLGAALLVPLILLGGLELVLRVAGYGFSTGYFKPLTIRDQPYFVDNDQFGLRFFPPALVRIPPPVVMKADKPAGTFRLFVFGESAAEGDPRPQYSASRYLEVLLRERFPEYHFEIVNTAVTAINSHVILPIARDCASHQGDLWIVYMGNNEMIGPFGAATAFGRRAPPLGIVRLGLTLQKARLGQLLLALTRKLTATSASPASWAGMEMFLENKISPGDPRKEIVYQNFQRNLEDILRAGLQSGSRVLLSTVAVNLKDCPPFYSFSLTNLPASKQSMIKDCLAQAASAEKQGAWSAAETNYQKAAEILPRSADIQFELGKCFLNLTNSAAAREHLHQAVDDDMLCFRADSRINGIIRESAQRLSGAVTLCDAEEELGTPNPPGQDLFYEHVHFTPEGNYRLAVLWADKIRTMLPALTQHADSKPWSTQSACDRFLGLTDWNRLSAVEEMIRRLGLPPFNGQANSAQRLAAFRTQAGELRQRMAATPVSEAAAVYVEALKREPDDAQLHENFAEFLEETGDLQRAVSERQTVCGLIPHYYFPYFSLGRVLKEQGKLAEAQEALGKALERNPRQAELHRELGVVLGRRSRWKEAWSELERAAQLGPRDPQLCLFSAEVLWKLERHEEAFAKLRETLSSNPNYWEAHYRLGENLAIEGRIAEAAAEFKEVVRLQPNYARAHLNLAVALLKMNRPDQAALEFEETLRLDPHDRQALDFLGKYRGAGPKP